MARFNEVSSPIDLRNSGTEKLLFQGQCGNGNENKNFPRNVYFAVHLQI